MRRTLYRKLILIYVILAIAGFTLISTVGSRMVEDSLVSSASTSLYREATQIASKQGDLYYHSERSLTDLYNSLSALASYHNSQIWLISADGEILLNTAAALDEENPEIIDGFDPVALGSEYYSTGTFFGYFEDKMLSVMVPVTSDFRINGYVAIHLPLQDVYQQRESLLARIDFLFLLVFGLSFVILIFFSLVVYRPLKKIINGAKEYASGNLTHKIDVKSHDEMGYLASTLNYMSGELNKTGEYQRNFVANVSHDFRSPLTSIKGYAEVLEENGFTDKEFFDKGISHIMSESDRMYNMVVTLLELSRMSDAVNVPKERVNLNDLMQQVCEGMQFKAEKFGDAIELTVRQRAVVMGSDTQLKEIFINIIDNAIKYGYPNSTIQVLVNSNRENVTVQVVNSGEGIDEKEIPKLFIPFYRRKDKTGPREEGSSGLGLGIVKQLVEQHGGRIDITSRPKGLTVVTVILPTARAREGQL